MGSSVKATPKRYFFAQTASYDVRIFKIGLPVRAGREPKNEVKKKGRIRNQNTWQVMRSPRPPRLPQRQVDVRVWSHADDTVIYFMFHCNPFMGFEPMWVEIWPFTLLLLLYFTAAWNTLQLEQAVILVTERWARSWSRCTVTQPAGDYISHPPGGRLHLVYNYQRPGWAACGTYRVGQKSGCFLCISII